MWNKFEIYSIKKYIFLVRKGRALYTTLYQEVFFFNPGEGGFLKYIIFQIRGKKHDWVKIHDWSIVFKSCALVKTPVSLGSYNL